MRILFYDVENLPGVATTFSYFNTSIPHTNIIEHQSLICIAWMWSDEKKVHLTSILDDPKRMKRDIYDDSHVAKTFHKVLNTDESFVLCGHNLAGFDVKKVNSAFLRHGLDPVPERQVIDTLKVCRKHFRLDSNRLDYVCRLLGIGEKLETGGMSLWNDIVQWKYPEVGKKADFSVLENALKKMGRYCQKDTKLLKPLLERLEPYMGNDHPNANLYQSNQIGCTHCGSVDFVRAGWRYTRTGKSRRYKCRSCKSRFDPPSRLKDYYAYDGTTA